MMAQRHGCLVELGAALVTIGGVAALLERCDGSALTFVTLLQRNAPGYRDTRGVPDPDSGNPTGTVINFAKRAQLCAAMVS